MVADAAERSMAGLSIVSEVIQGWIGAFFCRAWQSAYWQRRLPRKRRRLAKLRASEFSLYVRVGFRIQSTKH